LSRSNFASYTNVGKSIESGNFEQSFTTSGSYIKYNKLVYEPAGQN
jgi:hypothetical protein